MPSASRPASRTVGGSINGRALPMVRVSGASGTTLPGSTAESDAVVVSSRTLRFLVLTFPTLSTPMKVSWSWATPASPEPLVTRVQRVKSTIPVYGGTFQVKTPVLGAPPQVTVTEATPFTESASTLTGALREIVSPSCGKWMVSVGPTPPSPGTFGSPRSRQPVISNAAAESENALQRTEVRDKEAILPRRDAMRGYQTAARRGEKRSVHAEVGRPAPGSERPSRSAECGGFRARCIRGWFRRSRAG